jgi:hypothetical protein
MSSYGCKTATSPFSMTTARGLHTQQLTVRFSVTKLRQPAGRCRPDQVRRRRRWTRNVDDGGQSSGMVRAVRSLLDASWPSCRRPPFTVHIQGAIEQAEAGHAAANHVHVARDIATMFDELKAMANRRSGTCALAMAAGRAAGLHMGSHITCGLRCWPSTVSVGGVDAPAGSRPFPSDDRPAAASAPKPPCAVVPPSRVPRPCDTSSAVRVVLVFRLRDRAAQPARPLRPHPPTFHPRDVSHQVRGGSCRSRGPRWASANPRRNGRPAGSAAARQRPAWRHVR